MVDIEFVEDLETLDDLDEDAPYLFLVQIAAALLAGGDLLEKVPVVGEFHNNTASPIKLPETVRFLFPEGFLVEYDVRIADRGQQTDLVQSIFFFFFVEV